MAEDPMRVLETSLKQAPTDAARLAVLHSKRDPEEWIVKLAAPLMDSDETLCGETFAGSTRPSARAAAARYFKDDKHRVALLGDASAQVRLAAVEAMQSPELLEAHLRAETSPGVFTEQARNIRNVAEARIKALRTPQPQPQQPGTRSAQVIG
jgi:hypothetical protein